MSVFFHSTVTCEIPLNQWVWAVLHDDGYGAGKVWYMGTEEECRAFANSIKSKPLRVARIILRQE